MGRKPTMAEVIKMKPRAETGSDDLPPPPREPGADDGDEQPPPHTDADAPNAGTTRPWPEVFPLDRPAVPPFPVEVLPDWQRRMVGAAAAETETAPELAALDVLSAQAVACARRFQVEQRPGFLQPINLWLLSLLASGERKSRVFTLATAPLAAWEARKAEELGPRIASEGSAQRQLKGRLAKAEKVAADAKDPDARKAAAVEADDLAQQLAVFKVTRAPVLFVSEATPERMEELLEEQDGRAALLADEGGMLGLLGGRYSKGTPNLSTLLSAHDGGDVRIGRKRRDDGSGGDRRQLHALVTFGLSIQPETFTSAMRTNAAFFDTGFAWRFLFALVPSVKRTHEGPTVPEVISTEYAERMGELLDLPAPVGLDFPIVRPTPEALAALLTWEQAHESRVEAGGELEGLLRPWGRKLASRLCRIAALFHAAEHRRAPWAHPLEVETMKRAIALAPYFIAHARAVAFELKADPAMKLARAALEWIRRDKIERFSRHELHRMIARNEAAAVVDPALAILKERCFIRQALVEQAAEQKIGRPPGPAFEVNPQTHEAR